MQPTVFSPKPFPAQTAQTPEGPQTLRRRGRFSLRPLLAQGTLAALAAMLLGGGHSSVSQQIATPQYPSPGLATPINPRQDREDEPEVRRMIEKRIKDLNIQRQKSINLDSARLLQLAAELQADLAKTGKDTLTPDEIRKAEQIEKLAHNVRARMTDTIGQ